MPPWEPRGEFATEADRLWRELDKVVQRPARNFLTPTSRGVDRRLAPTLYRIIENLNGDLLKTRPTDALLATLSDGVARLPEGNPDGSIHTWTELGVRLFGLDADFAFDEDGKPRQYKDVKSELFQYSSKSGQKYRVRDMRGYLADALLELEARRLAGIEEPSVPSVQDPAIDLAPRERRSKRAPFALAAAASIILITILAVTLWPTSDTIESYDGIPVTFEFNGSLTAHNDTTRQASTSAGLNADLGDEITLTLDFINNTSRSFTSLPLLLKYDTGQQRDGTSHTPLLSASVLLAPTHEYAINDGGLAITRPTACAGAVGAAVNGTVVDVDRSGVVSETSPVEAAWLSGGYTASSGSASLTIPNAFERLTLYAVKPGEHFHLQIPVLLWPDSNSRTKSFLAGPDVVQFRAPKGAYSNLGAASTGQVLEVSARIMDSNCDLDTGAVTIKVATSTNRVAGDTTLVATANGTQLGSATINFEGGASHLSFVPGSAELFGVDAKHGCKPVRLRTLPDGVMQGGVSIGRVEGYLPHINCALHSDLRYVNFKVRVD